MRLNMRLNADIVLAITSIVAGCLITFVWAPVDSGTGLIERVRGRSSIGDALAPSLVGLLLAGSGALLLIMQRYLTRADTLIPANAIYVLKLIALVAIAIASMRWAGPLLVEVSQAFGWPTVSYRELRATPPVNYVGFLMGGTILVAGLIAMIENRLSLRCVVIGAVTSLVIALLIDIPFNNLLLPPNGDV